MADLTPEEQIATDLNMTYLQMIALEAREIADQLTESGFSKAEVTQIIGHMMYDATADRFAVYDDDFEDEDYDPDDEQ